MMKKLGALLLLLLMLASCGPMAEPETTSSTTTESITETKTQTALAPEIESKTRPAPTETETQASTTEKPTSTSKSGSSAGAYAYDYPGITPVAAAVPADPYLLCVSRKYALPSNYTPSLQPSIKGSDIQLEAAAAAQYQLMYDAAKAEGAILSPYSGYRSTARQKNNFERLIQTNVDRGHSYAEAVNMAAQVILPPGCTEHSAGLAMDIVSTETSFENTKEFAWLMAHGHEYGFILRYPKDKVAITDIIYEPWHWRYVGIGPAAEMRASGQCLEEYLGLA